MEPEDLATLTSWSLELRELLEARTRELEIAQARLKDPNCREFLEFEEPDEIQMVEAAPVGPTAVCRYIRAWTIAAVSYHQVPRSHR